MRIIVTLILSIVFFSSKAQNPAFFSADENRIFGKIVNNSLYILRQDYYVIDTTIQGGKRYGLNKKDYFGRFYYTAIAINGKFIVDKSINTPWELDSNFSKYNVNNKYKPELGELAFKRVDDKKYTLLETFDSARFNKLNAYCKIKYKDSISIQSFSTYNFKDSMLIDTTAWFWLADIKPDERNEDVNIQFESSKGKYSPAKDGFTNNKFFYSENSKAGFIFCTIPEFGAIKYYLCGVIIKIQGKFSFISFKNEILLDKISEKKSLKEISNLAPSTLDEIPVKEESSNQKSASKKKKRRNE